MQTKTKITILICILLISVFLALFEYKAKKQSENLNSKNSSQNSSASGGSSVKDLKQNVADIIKSENLSQCDGIEDAQYRKVCINNIAQNLAQKNLDVTYCDKLDNENFSVSDCKEAVIDELSIKNKDISICDKLADLSGCRRQYWQIIALKYDNVSLCDQAQDDEQKNLCRNNYVLQKFFLNDPKKTDCSQFASTAVQDDCKEVEDNPQRGCQKLSSEIFSEYCLNLAFGTR